MNPSQTYHIEETNLERQRLLAQFLGPFTTSVLNKSALQPNARRLDLGCGIGETTRLIASFLKDGGSCGGLDQNPELIQSGIAGGRRLTGELPAGRRHAPCV